MKAEKNKRVVITGATGSLGRALAAEFIRQGHIVAGFGRATKRIRELRAEFGGPHTFDEVDVADDTQFSLGDFQETGQSKIEILRNRD
jgi:NADP-dependent 3-hydroxy acid dehydrogenase YdfG